MATGKTRTSDLTMLSCPAARLCPLHFPLFLPIRLIPDKDGDQVLTAQRPRVFQPSRQLREGGSATSAIEGTYISPSVCRWREVDIAAHLVMSYTRIAPAAPR